MYPVRELHIPGFALGGNMRNVQQKIMIRRKCKVNPKLLTYDSNIVLPASFGRVPYIARAPSSSTQNRLACGRKESGTSSWSPAIASSRVKCNVPNVTVSPLHEKNKFSSSLTSFVRGEDAPCRSLLMRLGHAMPKRRTGLRSTTLFSGTHQNHQLRVV